ncbi:MAG: hypothetical protein R3B48_15715 [Kofleriaceae bacterium]
MSPRLSHLCIFGGLLLLAPLRASADADALLDTMGPREIAVGEALRGSAVGSSAATLNPAGLPLTRELVFEGGYGYRPSDRASLVNASACDSTNAVPGCFYYNYVGASPEFGGMEYRRRVHTGGLTVSRAMSSSLIIGTGVKYFNVKSMVGAEGDSSGLTFDAGLTLRVNDGVHLGVAGYNLWGEEAAQFPRAVGGGFSLRPISALRATFDVLFKLDQPEGTKSGRLGGGLEYFLQSGSGKTALPLRLGGLYDRASDRTFISGGIGIATAKFGFDVAGRRATKGEEDLLVVASLRFFGPRDPVTTSE